MKNWKYGVRYSGHGSGFIFDKFKSGSIFRYTLKEANKLALDWELNSCTIGGRAEIVREDGAILDIVE